MDWSIESSPLHFMVGGHSPQLKDNQWQQSLDLPVPFEDHKVLFRSDDAISDEKKGLIYSSIVRMDKSTMNVEGRQVD